MDSWVWVWMLCELGGRWWPDALGFLGTQIFGDFCLVGFLVFGTQISQILGILGICFGFGALIFWGFGGLFGGDLFLEGTQISQIFWDFLHTDLC